MRQKRAEVLRGAERQRDGDGMKVKVSGATKCQDLNHPRRLKGCDVVPRMCFAEYEAEVPELEDVGDFLVGSFPWSFPFFSPL